MALPEHMSIVPHTYQLKGAAQIDWACRGPFQGIMIGDAMGLGKTLQAILAMWLCRDEPGMSLVVAPASLCSQWIRSIETSWEEVRFLLFYPIHDHQNRPCRFQLTGRLLY
jgi:SNF2 family DNA or RNA helicase